jgi:hypothetical protein
MDYSSLKTASDIITAFRECQNAGEQIDLFEALATSYEPPVSAFVEILRGVKLEPLIVLTIQAFGKIKDVDIRERLQQSDNLLTILSEKAQSGETDSIRLSAAKTVINLEFDFIAISRYFREDPKKIADRIMRDKSKNKRLFDDKYNEVRDLKYKLDRQLAQIQSTNSDVYDSVIANNKFKDVPSVNIEEDDEYDLILNNYAQSLHNEVSRLQSEITKFYRGYKENQLAIVDNKITRGKASLEKAESVKTISLLAYSLIMTYCFWLFSDPQKRLVSFIPVTLYSLFVIFSSLHFVREYRRDNWLFTILLSLVPGGILPVIIIKIYERTIKSAYKNIEEAENRKADELYRLNDEEQKILSLLSI